MAAGDAAECRACRALADAYASPLAHVHPITYTAPRWRLCVGVRVLKDVLAARSDSVPARNIGAILSAYLEHHLGGRRLGQLHGFGVVTTVPSSRPVIAGALRRAALEGWWSPEVTVVATARPGHARQRQRPDAERMYVRGRWEVDRAAVDGLDVLVIDDIYTSGGSVQSLAGALRDAGARSVRAVVLARNVGAQDAAWVLSLLRRYHDRGWRWTPSVGAYDVLARDRPAVMSATREAVSRCDGGTRDRARSAAREARTQSCPPCRPRS